MSDQSETKKEYMYQMEDILSQNQSCNESDWNKTIQNLLTLAKEANKSFDFDRAINYLDTLEQIEDSKSTLEFSFELRSELHKEKGKSFASLGKHEEAISEYQKILKFCNEYRHLSVKSETFMQIGQLLAKQGDHDRALGYLQRAMGAYRRLEDTVGICKALRNLGVIYVELGEFEEAELNYRDAIKLANETGNRILHADLINNLGTIMDMKGNWQKALELYRKSLTTYKVENEIRKSAYTMNNLAITLTEQGMNDEAFDYFQKAYEIAGNIKDASLILIVDINLADLYLKKELLPEARKHCQKAEQYLRKAEIVNCNLVETKKIAGKLARHDNDYKGARKYFNEALKLSRQIGAPYLEAEVLMERGILFRIAEESFDALADLESSYHLFNKLKVDGKRLQTEKVINSIEELYLEIFNSMARKVDLKDKYTKGHSDRVASLALLLSKELGLQTNMLKTIAAASLLHDIGKIKIEDSILKKEGKLTDEEFHKIKKHPELGVDFLKGKEFPWRIKPLIMHHHEKLDGRGYPLGLKGEEIPLGARIICIADVFDALTSDRVYRLAYDTKKALKIMNDESGTTFDPALLECFTRLVNQGKVDMVINSRSREDELYTIWSQCMDDNGMQQKTRSESLV